jgi:hypothetical protein
MIQENSKIFTNITAVISAGTHGYAYWQTSKAISHASTNALFVLILG